MSKVCVLSVTYMVVIILLFIMYIDCIKCYNTILGML